MNQWKKQNDIGFSKLSLAFLLATAVFAKIPAIAGDNSFFGANAGGSNNQSSADVDETNMHAGMPGLTTPPAMPPSGDYTDDEKRMQRKYRGNIAHAKELISKGEGMMKSSGKDDKTFKKGKILKETGEKWLAELKANDPYAGDKPVSSGTDTKETKSKEPAHK
jgi:hypothetical protein